MYLGGRISRLLLGVAVLFGIIGMGVFAMNRPVAAVAGINEHLNFQGRLYNSQGAIVPDGYYNIQFKIYQDGAGTTAGNPGGTLKWTENWLNSGTNGVQIKNGYLSVELGSVTPFGTSIDWNQDTLWLSMNIGDTTSCTITTDFDTDCGGDGEMVPMKRMSSSVYSLNSGRLGGLNSSQFVQLAQGVQTDASTNTTSIFLNKTGGGNFLQLQSSTTDVFTLTNSGDIEFGANNDHTISVTTAGAGTGGYDLTVSAGTGGSGTGSAGGDLVLQGGAAGGTDGNGGNVVINAGAKTGTGTDGTVSIGTGNTSAITLGADTTVTGNFTVSGSSSLALNKGTDYSTISGNDVNFGSGSVFRLTGASSQTITGIAGGTDGRMITLINSSSFNATLSNLSGSSSSANQISTGTGADMILSVGGAISLIYDSGSSKWRVVAAAADSAGAGGVTLQGSTPGTADVGNINVTGTIIGDVVQGTSHIYTPDLDTASAGVLTIGTSVATGITIGSASITTTIQGNLAVTLSSTTGTTMVCQNGSGYFSDCDSSYQAPTSTNFIQNQNSSQQTGNYWISGVARADTGVLAPSIDVAAAGTLSIGTTTATAITIGQSAVDTTIAGGLIVTEASTFNEDVTIAAGKSLTLTGGNTASRPGSPTAGMVYYDTDTDQLLTYNGSKWQADRSTTTKIVAASNSSQAVKDAADYVADGTSDESEINSALTAAAGGTVYLAEGTYVAGGTILVPNNTILAGAGNGTTIELADLDATDNLIENKDSTAGNATPGSGVVIRDLKLDGRSDLNTAGTQYGIYFSDMGSGTGASAIQGATLENLRITRFRNDGTYLTASSNNIITNSNFRNNGAVGLSINASSNNNVISNNRFQGNGAEGFVLSSSSYNNVSGNNSEANTTLGMNFTSGGSRNTISGNNINSNGTSGMRLSGETRSTIVGNVIRGGGASNYGIYMLNSSNNNAVSSNNIYDTGSAGYTNGIFLDVASYNNLTNNVIGDSSCTLECRAININNAGATNNFIASNNIDSGASIRDTGTGTIYGGQNSGTAYLIQPSQDVTIGGASNTTTIQGNTAVTLSSTTGTTMVCQNGSGYLSACDASYLTPTATNFIQNQNSSQQTGNYWISGVARADTGVLAPSIDVAAAGTLSIGTTTATAITIGQSGVTTTNAGNLTVTGTTTLNDNVTVAAGKTLRVTGDTRANITSIGSPTAGMITYDTTNNQLLTYNGTKWKADGKEAILVAANDSSQADKDAADYVVDGTADDVEIQAALDAADPASGTRKTGKVYLFAGTYNVSTSINIKNNTTIAGAGRGTLLSLISTTSAVKVLTNNDTTTGTGVTIQNLRIDGNNGTVGAQYGIYLDGMGGGTGASSRQGAKVNNVILTNFNTANLYLNASSHGTFSGISSQGSDGDGIALSTSNYNTFTGNTLSGNTGDGFDVSNSNSDTFSGNTIQNNSGSGVSTSTSSYNLDVSGNTFRQNGTNGITMNQITYSTISNNSFYSNTGDGINVVGGASSSLSITGNSMYNNTGDGIDLTAAHTSITGNTLVSNVDGIVVRNGSNQITGNITRSNSNAGISLNGTSADNNTVSGNTVSANTLYGIYLSNADDNNIGGNRIFDNGGLTTNNGIYLSASDSNSIQSNTLSDGNASSNNYSINIFNATSDTNYLSDNTLGTGTINDAGTGTLYGGQSSSTAYLLQPGTNITIGSASTTTTIQGNTAVTLSGTTGTTMVCQNGSNYLSACDASILAPTATNFIQNQNSSDQTANFRISGVAQANTSVLTPLVGRATAGTLSIGTDANSTAITIGQSGVTTTNAGNLTVSGTTTLNDNVTIAADKSLRITGSGTLPGSPTAGMLYYDTTNNQLLTYNGSKWKADGSDAVLVAANDSSAADKQAADYVVDGTADESEINTALTAASSSGTRKTGKVYLFAGTYSLAASISIPDNVTLAGSGVGTQLTIPSAQNGSYAMITNTNTTTGTGVTVQDLYINGNKAGQSSGGMMGIYFNSMGGGSGTSARTGGKISNVVVKNMYGTGSSSNGVGIRLSSSNNNVVIDNKTQANGYVGIFVSNSSSHNTITGNLSQGNTSYGVYLNASNNTFSSNTVQGNTNTGIYASVASNNTITGNTLISNGSNGIRLTATSENNTITGNSFITNSAEGIYLNSVNRNTITGNMFKGNTTGVTLDTASYNTISGNQFTSNTTSGISLTLTSTYNTVSANTIYDTGGATVNNGIYISSSSNNSITGNTINDPSASSTNYAVEVFNAGASANYLADNSLGGGSVHDNGTGTIYGGQADASGNYVVQPAGDINLVADTNITGTLTATTALQAPLLDTSSASALNIGTTNATQINLNQNTTLVGDLTLDAAANRTISIGTSAASTAGSQLTIAAGTGGSGTGSVGGDLVLQGGNAGGTNANGGNLYLDAGAGTGTGSGGSIYLGYNQPGNINIGTGTGNYNINIGTGTGTQNVVIGATTGGGSTTIQSDTGGITLDGSGGAISIGNGSATGANIQINAAGNMNFDIGGSQALAIRNSTGATTYFSVDSSTGQITAGAGTLLYAQGDATFQNGITIQGGSSLDYTTPLGANLDTVINVPNYAMGAFGTIMSFGISNCTNPADLTPTCTGSSYTPSTARGILLADARNTAHQATIGVLSPDENDIFGFSWNGSNTRADLEALSADVGIRTNGQTVGTFNSANGLTLDSTGSTVLTLQGDTMAGTNGVYARYFDAQAASDPLNIGTVNAGTIQIGNASLSSGTQTINIGNNNTSGGTTNVVIGSGGSATAGTTTLQAKDGITINTNGVTRQTFNNTNTVYFGNGVTAAAPNAFTISGTGSSTSGTAGGALSIQGGNATVGNANGGNLTLSGGTGVGSGSNGLVVLTTPTFQTVTNDANCYTGGSLVASSCTMAASSVNNSSAIIVGFNTIGQTATMPDPTITTAGRIVYVTAANSSQDFTLSVNGGGTGNTIAMRQNTTATMIWNGSDWTAAGASSSTTLQSAYDNTLQSAGGAELVVSSTGNTNGLTIRDSSVNPVNDTLLSIQSSSAANLFSVNSNVTEYASNAGAESYSGTTTTFPASTWSALTGATVSRNTTTSNIATGQGSAQAATTTSTNSGIKNQLNSALTASQHYNVSFTAKLASGTFTDMGVYYSIDGSADSVTCATGVAIKTSVWTKVNCTFTAPSSGITSSNSINIRQVGGGTARTFYIDNLSVTIAADYNYATDGTVNDAGNFATNWTSTGTGSTVTHNTSDGQEASDSAQAVITTGGTNRGVRNKIAINPLTSTLYRISVYAKQTSGAAFTDFGIRYSRDGGTNFVDCVDYNTQTVDNTWTQITCYIQTDSTAPSGSGPYMYFVAGSSANRTFLVDTFSMTLASKSTPNVQIGGGAAGGPTTLFTLDKGASAPIAANNDDLLGSMYYDTTLGKLQCYEADGWGACGSSPDNIVTISPEYTNAVLHGTGVGTMTSDLCSDTLNINDGSSGQATICGTNETYNFYKWTSPQSSAQTYSIYVTYQLPSTFKAFQSGQTSIMGRTDSANATVNYQIYRNNTSSGLTTCGSAVTVSTGSVSSWQTGIATGAADPSTCGFVGGDSVVFKINVTASQNANAYVGNLNFTFSNR